jgi:transcriptional regulator with XRE-family HTH domain
MTTSRRVDLGSGRRLRAERKRRGIALLALATRAGCSTQTLLAVERYGYSPVPTTRRRIAAALGVPVATVWTARRLDDQGDDAA